MQAPRRSQERDRRELEILHRVALTLSATLSFDDVLTALARELVFGVERACECAISVWEPEHDHLVDKAVFTVHGTPTWPEGPAQHAARAEFRETRAHAAARHRLPRVPDQRPGPASRQTARCWTPGAGGR